MAVLDRFKILKEEANLNNKQFEEKVGFSNGTFSNWDNGKSNPSIDSVRKVAMAFNVSADWLLELDNRQPSILAEGEQLLLDTFRECSETDKYKLMHYCMTLQEQKGLQENVG